MITSGCRDTLTLPEELDNTRLSIADSIILFLLKHTRQLALPISSFDLVANSYENLIKAHNNTSVLFSNSTPLTLKFDN